MLWLQEQCARTLIPLVKVPGEGNPADLMTKHLVGPVLKRHTDTVKLEFRSGRSDKAAKLHRMCRKDAAKRSARLCAVEFNGRGGGDYWQSTGENGIWIRIHRSPRLGLCTPYGYHNGPADKSIDSIRETHGVN